LDSQSRHLAQETNDSRHQCLSLQQQVGTLQQEVDELKDQCSRERSLLDERDALLKRRAVELKEKEKQVEELQKKYQEAGEVVRRMEKSEKGSSGQVLRAEREAAELREQLQSSRGDLDDHKKIISNQETKIQVSLYTPPPRSSLLALLCSDSTRLPDTARQRV
jgi:septal ring factor EnvC (AmiA/AmiB activator)